VVWDNPPDWAIASKNAVDLAAGDATPSEIRVVLPKPAPPPNAVRLRQRGMRGQVRL
jgi:hypothetical protein